MIPQIPLTQVGQGTVSLISAPVKLPDAPEDRVDEQVGDDVPLKSSLRFSGLIASFRSSPSVAPAIPLSP